MADCSQELLALYLSKLRDLRRRLTGAIEQMDDSDVNWRPNEASNSVSNLVIHMAGNMHQRLESGIGGLFDTRDRDGEFNHREHMTCAEVQAIVDRSFDIAERVVAGLSPSDLAKKQVVRDHETTILGVIFSVVTHLPEHVGQILYIAKLRRSEEYQILTIPHRTK